MVGPYDPSMVMIYPKEGSMARSNCACIVNADWVSEEEKEGARVWIEYLHEEQQQRIFMRRGFRPATGLVLASDDPDNRITDEFGLNPATPDPVLNVFRTKPDVAAAIDASWVDVKRPGIVTFVVDTSGSMKGEKLQQAKDGLVLALDSMAPHNQVGFITFANNVGTISPVLPLTSNKSALGDAVFNMEAIGRTALYDAIKAGVELSDRATGEENAIRAVVVVTDGQANQGVAGLDDIIEMMTKNEVPILDYPGREDGPNPIDENGRTVDRDNIIGTKLALQTEHDIQIFFIGVGEEPDLQIGGLLAEATGAEFIGVTEEDLANVLEEFSKYF